MTRLAHISDTHFGTEEAAVCRALRDDLAAMAPDLVILTGDITQRARRTQFQAAQGFLDSLGPVPVLAIPGNHDLPLFDLLTRFAAPYRLYREHICPTLAPVWQNAQVAVLGINSTRPRRHKNGELPAELVRQVAGQLAGFSQPYKILALHHPLAVVTPADRPNRVRSAEAALAAWIGAGADLFLGGHIHLPYCLPVGDGPRQAILLQAGTAVSRRRRGLQPNSYNLIHLESGEGRRHMHIEQRDYDGQAGGFIPGVSRRAEAAGNGWRLQPAPGLGGGPGK